ncbi:g7028 [Coccomyxa viridis]|uniref:G7028 protein n=1 Tax=Coccomyxa viridis TaxID=1274662 RepID=A0ABP1FZ65_9CHLO
MSCYVKSRAEKDVNPTDGPAQPSEARAWDGADQSFGRRPSHEHSSGTPVRMAMPGLDEELSSQSHKGVKKRGRGRPVIYQGDPDAPGLDPAQRRLLQRRISNRESARRTRKRHQEHAESLYAKAKSLHRNCNILVAQVDALELKRSQSEALEKEMADVLRMKDEQMDALRRKSESLQNVIYRLMRRLYAKDQDLRLQMCFGLEGCRSAMATPHGSLQGPDVSCAPGSGSLSQYWDPFAPSESAAQHMCDFGWPLSPSHIAGLATSQASRAEPSSLVACDPPQVPTFSDKGLELPDLSTSPEAGHAQADFIYMVRELDLLPYGDTSTNTMTA